MYISNALFDSVVFPFNVPISVLFLWSCAKFQTKKTYFGSLTDIIQLFKQPKRLISGYLHVNCDLRKIRTALICHCSVQVLPVLNRPLCKWQRHGTEIASCSFGFISPLHRRIGNITNAKWSETFDRLKQNVTWIYVEDFLNILII